MYRFGKADKAVKLSDGSGYKVMVYTNSGYTTMGSLMDGEWQTCVFPNLAEAERAMSDYNEFSWEA